MKPKNNQRNNHANMENSILNEIAASQDVRNCAYPKCENVIAANSEFEFCELCRCLTNRNSIAILLDPASPVITDRADLIRQRTFHNMRPDEKINYLHHLETEYLNLQRELKSRDMETYRRKQLDDATEEVRRIRDLPSPAQAKREDKRSKRKNALIDFMGGDVEKAKEILGKRHDISDL